MAAEQHYRGMIIRLVVESEDPLTGTAQVENEDDAQPFAGWLDLLRILSHRLDNSNR